MLCFRPGSFLPVEKPDLNAIYSCGMISFLLYVPQFLHTRCGTMSSPHLLHFTSVGAAIFQFALLWSRLPLDDLFLGQIDIVSTSSVSNSCHLAAVVNRTFRLYRLASALSTCFYTSATVSLQIASSSFVATTTTLTLESGVEIAK